LRLKKSDWIFVAVAGTVIGLLVVLSLQGRKAQPLSPIPQHAGVTEATKRADCLACHEPGQPGVTFPIPASHPQAWKKEQLKCTECHHAPAAQTAAQTAAHDPNILQEIEAK
jgi:hypothetical protein